MALTEGPRRQAVSLRVHALHPDGPHCPHLITFQRGSHQHHRPHGGHHIIWGNMFRLQNGQEVRQNLGLGTHFMPDCSEGRVKSSGFPPLCSADASSDLTRTKIHNDPPSPQVQVPFRLTCFCFCLAFGKGNKRLKLVKGKGPGGHGSPFPRGEKGVLLLLQSLHQPLPMKLTEENPLPLSCLPIHP